jgi:DNA-binding NarL/FixJ family response regulator
MKAAASKKPIRVAVVESARLPFDEINSQVGIEVVSSNLAELGSRKDIHILLLSTSKNMLDFLAGLNNMRPDLRIILIGNDADETIMKFLASGVKGYVEEAASVKEFFSAVRTVHMGSVWMPKRMLSIFIERVRK